MVANRQPAATRAETGASTFAVFNDAMAVRRSSGSPRGALGYVTDRRRVLYRADGIRAIVDAADSRCRSASTIISISCLKST